MQDPHLLRILSYPRHVDSSPSNSTDALGGSDSLNKAVAAPEGGAAQASVLQSQAAASAVRGVSVCSDGSEAAAFQSHVARVLQALRRAIQVSLYFAPPSSFSRSSSSVTIDLYVTYIMARVLRTLRRTIQVGLTLRLPCFFLF